MSPSFRLNLLYGLHQCKRDDRKGARQTDTDQRKQGYGLDARKPRCFYGLCIQIRFQGDKPRPLLVFKLTAIQRPKKHDDADDKSGRHVCDEIRKIHFSLIG